MEARWWHRSVCVLLRVCCSLLPWGVAKWSSARWRGLGRRPWRHEVQLRPSSPSSWRRRSPTASHRPWPASSARRRAPFSQIWRVGEFRPWRSVGGGARARVGQMGWGANRLKGLLFFFFAAHDQKQIVPRAPSIWAQKKSRAHPARLAGPTNCRSALFPDQRFDGHKGIADSQFDTDYTSIPDQRSDGVCMYCRPTSFPDQLLVGVHDYSRQTLVGNFVLWCSGAR